MIVEMGTAVNAVTWSTSVVQAVSESIARLIVIVESPMCTAVSVVIFQTFAAQAVWVNIVQVIMTVELLLSTVI